MNAALRFLRFILDFIGTLAVFAAGASWLPCAAAEDSSDAAAG
jgi:hypothetical protein